MSLRELQPNQVQSNGTSTATSEVEDASVYQGQSHQQAFTYISPFEKNRPEYLHKETKKSSLKCNRSWGQFDSKGANVHQGQSQQQTFAYISPFEKNCPEDLHKETKKSFLKCNRCRGQFYSKGETTHKSAHQGTIDRPLSLVQEESESHPLSKVAETNKSASAQC